MGIVVPYNPGMRVTNLAELPACKGARYLEVMVPHEEGLPLIAVAWRHKKPVLPKGHSLIEFPTTTKGRRY